MRVENVLTKEEDLSLNALEMRERMLTFIAAVGFEEQVDKVLDNSGEILSEAAVSVKSQIQERISAMNETQKKDFEISLLKNFEYVTVEIGGQEYVLPVLEVEVKKDDQLIVVRYGFYVEDGMLKFGRIELPKETVKNIQTALNHLGYNCGEVDGIYGSQTRNALTSFQQDNALYDTGAMTFETMQALRDMGMEI